MEGEGGRTTITLTHLIISTAQNKSGNDAVF